LPAAVVLPRHKKGERSLKRAHEPVELTPPFLHRRPTQAADRFAHVGHSHDSRHAAIPFPGFGVF